MCFKSIFSNFTLSVATPYTKPHLYKKLSVKSVPKAQNQDLCGRSIRASGRGLFTKGIVTSGGLEKLTVVKRDL